ncbi:MAG: hypothetical protein IT279_14730 [Ignavibacteriaceae bacterium]|nr:hypothetical protein [Ignavibacteriaceae bacterium]
MEPFRRQEHLESSRLTVAGATVEINNLLAAIPSLFQLSQVDIEAITNRCLPDVSQIQIYDKLAGFYRIYLEYCLVDKKLTQDEIKSLQHLKRVFLLSDKTVKSITSELISQIYMAELQTVLEDGVITSEEASFLMKLRRDLVLDNESAEKLYETATRDFLNKKIAEALEDERLTEEEEAELTRIAESLNIDIYHDKRTRELLERYRIYWLIENGQLPVVLGQIPFNPDEECHYMINDVLWYEEEEKKDESETMNRFTMRRRLNKLLESSVRKTGLSDVRIGNFLLIEKGTIYFSNSKIYFQGEHNGMFIEYENISGFEVYENGIKILLGSGAKHLLQFNDKIDIVCLLINRLMYS